MFKGLANQKIIPVDAYSRQLTEVLPTFQQNYFLNKLPHWVNFFMFAQSEQAT